MRDPSILYRFNGLPFGTPVVKNDDVCDVFFGMIRWGQRTLQRRPRWVICIGGEFAAPTSSRTPTIISHQAGSAKVRILVPATPA